MPEEMALRHGLRSSHALVYGILMFWGSGDSGVLSGCVHSLRCFPWRLRQGGRGARARRIDRVAWAIGRGLGGSSSLAVSLWFLIGFLSVSVITLVSVLFSRFLGALTIEKGNGSSERKRQGCR